MVVCFLYTLLARKVQNLTNLTAPLLLLKCRQCPMIVIVSPPLVLLKPPSLPSPYLRETSQVISMGIIWSCTVDQIAGVHFMWWAIVYNMLSLCQLVFSFFFTVYTQRWSFGSGAVLGQCQALWPQLQRQRWWDTTSPCLWVSLTSECQWHWIRRR